MSSISQRQPGLQPQGQSNASQVASRVHSSPSLSGKSSPLAPVLALPSSTAGTYANAIKRSAESDFPGASVVLGGPAQAAQYGRAPSLSPMNGRPSMQQSQLSEVTIVNGASQGDHSRKPSVTISSAGTTGFKPNGAPVGGVPSRTNNIQFGALNQGSPAMGSPAVLANQVQGSLGVAPPANPRINSPQTSPAPIPQPASSGGRPPSTYPSHGNAPSLISFGDSDINTRQMRPTHQAPLGPSPQPSHLRRESSQSAHGDMSGQMGGAPGGAGRGYPHQGGRGRGFSQSSYQGQIPFSPSSSYRPNPSQTRGAPNIPQYHGHNQGRPLGPPYPSSPHQATRSPALANSHPATPQMSAAPMAHPQMQAQHFGAYNQHMPPQTVRHHSPSSKPSSRHPFPKRLKGTRFSSSAPYPPSSVHLPPPNLAPESGQFEEYLKLMQDQNYHATYDPGYGYYPPYGMQYITPSSPQPRPGIPYTPQAPFIQNQYPAAVQPPAQAAPLSRSPSQVSSERPGSSLGQGPPPSAPPPGHTHSTSRSSNSPAPAQNTQFVKPSTKRVLIKDPNSGAVKTFDKQPVSPARATPSPVKGSTPTPPPRTGSGADHSRPDNKNAKTDEEKKRELRDAVRMKLEEGEEAERRKKEAEVARKSMEDLPVREENAAAEEQENQNFEPAKEITDTPVANAESIVVARELEQNETLKEPTSVVVIEAEKVREESIDKAREVAVEPMTGSCPKQTGDEIDLDIIERELAEKYAKEAEAEEAAEAEYMRKKQAEKAEKERKEREAAESWERNMKNAEREAEAAEEARLKRLDTGDDDSGRRERDELFASLRKGLGSPAPESPAAHTPADSGAATPVSSDVSMGPPAKPTVGAKREKPAALKLEINKPVEPPQPSAAMKSLHTARFIKDLAKITYPPSIVSPNPALNANAPTDRKFKYNKEFLLQFQNVFKEKPSLDWDARVRETVGDSGEPARPQSARTPMMGGRNPSRPGIPLPFQTGPMGTFTQSTSRQTLPSGAPSDRIPMPGVGRAGSIGSNPFGPFGRPGGMVAPPISRTSSSAALHASVPQSPRIGSSSRGGTRTGSKRDRQVAKKEDDANKAMPLTASGEFKALTTSAGGWKPRSVVQTVAGPAPGGDGHLTPDVVQRKVKASLNKMTPDNFDRISDQILTIVSQSKDESDGRTLRQVIQLTFEKATDEGHWAPMYARFCKRMLESMSPEIKDEDVRDRNGNLVTGGSLFRKYLLNRCQEEFERGWKVNLPPRPEGVAALLSDEYYAAAAAKRRGLGLVKFIGELYKLGMLTERIMHECVKKLVDYEGIPDEAEVESLTSLLRTIGASLDISEKGHAMMDAYFGRINKMIETAGLPSRLKFMLMDVVDLRDARWRTKYGDKGPKTLTEIREDARHQQEEQDRVRQQQATRGGGGRVPIGRDTRQFSAEYRNQTPPQDLTSNKVGSEDLRRLKTSRASNQLVSLGPPNMFGPRSSSGRRNLGPGGSLVRGGDDSGASSRTGTPPASKDRKEDKETISSNTFSALAGLDERDNLATSPPSNPSSPPMLKSRPAIERRQSKSPFKDGEGAA